MRLSVTLSITLLGFLSFVSSLPTGTPDVDGRSIPMLTTPNPTHDQHHSTPNEKDPNKADWFVGDSFETISSTSRGKGGSRRVLVLYVWKTTIPGTEEPQLWILYVPLYTRSTIDSAPFSKADVEKIPWKDKSRSTYSHFGISSLVWASVSSLDGYEGHDHNVIEHQRLIDYILKDENNIKYKILGTDDVILGEDESNKLLGLIGKNLVDELPAPPSPDSPRPTLPPSALSPPAPPPVLSGAKRPRPPSSLPASLPLIYSSAQGYSGVTLAPLHSPRASKLPKITHSPERDVE